MVTATTILPMQLSVVLLLCGVERRALHLARELAPAALACEGSREPQPYQLLHSAAAADTATSCSSAASEDQLILLQQYTHPDTQRNLSTCLCQGLGNSPSEALRPNTTQVRFVYVYKSDCIGKVSVSPSTHLIVSNASNESLLACSVEKVNPNIGYVV